MTTLTNTKMRERALWLQLSAGMGSLWHAQRHEDRYSVGVPDVSFAMAELAGWIELKSLNRPQRHTFDLPQLSTKQRVWMTRRTECAGVGHCFVLVRWVNAHGSEYVLHDWIYLDLLLVHRHVPWTSYLRHAVWRHFGPNPDWSGGMYPTLRAYMTKCRGYSVPRDAV